MLYAIETRPDGSKAGHAFAYDPKYRFYIEGRANTRSTFTPCTRGDFETCAAYVHQCGGPRRALVSSGASGADR